MSKTEINKTWSKDSSIDFSRLRKSEQTRQNILGTALDFLWTNPFRDLTVSGLTKKAGVSRTSFYQHFDDLHNLMEELLNDLAREIDAVAEPWFTAKSDVTLKLSISFQY